MKYLLKLQKHIITLKCKNCVHSARKEIGHGMYCQIRPERHFPLEKLRITPLQTACPLMKYKYNIINESGHQEAWTGVFDTIELAKKWLARYWTPSWARGRKLVLATITPELPKEPKILNS